MRIDSPKVSNLTFQDGAAVADSSFTGSFSGSFTGVGNFTGLTADSVEYSNVLNKPTLISQSAQITITESQISDLSHYSDSDADARIAAASVTDLTDVTNAGSGIIISADERTKLSGIETSADVTDTANVTAAGALMDSEVTNLADVKAFDPADYATAAQGSTADSAQQPPSEGAFVDGDKTKLDGIEASADVTDTTNVVAALTAGTNVAIAADGTISSTDTNTQLSTEAVQDIVGGMVSGNTESGITVTYQDGDGTIDFSVASQTDQNFTSALKTKLDGIEASADVTDATNVASSLVAATSITSGDKTTIQSNLGVDAAGTDNSTNVTLGGSLDYITISGQVLTRNAINLSTDVTGTLPVGNMSATALTTVQTAADESAQLALTTEEGDVVVRTDENKTYMHNGGTAGTMADFTLLATPTDAVTSVNGNTGVVTVAENVTTNLGITGTTGARTITSSDGTNATIPVATDSVSGVMSAADHTKLSGIETSADVTDTTNVVAALSAGTNISIAADGTISSTDTNTVYTHPNHTGDVTSTGDGATVIANDAVTYAKMQNVSATDRILGRDSAGAGNVEEITPANLRTMLNVADGANNYSLPLATDSVRGGIELFSNTDQTTAANAVTTTAGRTYGIQLNSANQAVVNVPWTDTNTQNTRATLNIDTDDGVQFASLGIGTAASGTAGEIRATGDITAYYSSDERLKENFAPLTGALDKVKAIGGYEFDWKDGIEDVVSKKGHDIGVKAQELQAQYPELVHERDNGYLAVDYIKLNAVLIEAVKELAAKVALLENK